ncbi:MAG: hypothetical protein HOL07_12280 [Rhodospirillaceae bacterium]|jgi:pilus assembly protein CpaD|nr:hypothetical protein [Rhodospirillaceae bacterium]MBT4771375.1 hypothetical protein [Rhodospirillaceae bacterium]MBT5359115.1 hypothetical protein [Rhodospirillaceae bacterium]MBT5768985.1 hypothetical protein [Rhodospirillaceae bacterium]MBT6403125.1 hypothetical protein [Rhodospirillaceae bacterium]
MMRRQKLIRNRRIFTKRPSRWWPLLAVAAVIVTGCAQSLADYSPAQSTRDIQVRWVSLDHAVLFDPGTSVLKSSERFHLDAFLEGLTLRRGDRFLVDTGDTGGLDPLAQARATTISQRLRRHLPGVDALMYSGGGAPAGGARLVVGRYVAVPPNCPNWSRPSGANPGNITDSNFGCSAATNLSLMIADPADLVRGRSLAPGDGQALSLGIQRYRANKVKNPVAIETNE